MQSPTGAQGKMQAQCVSTSDFFLTLIAATGCEDQAQESAPAWPFAFSSAAS